MYLTLITTLTSLLLRVQVLPTAPLKECAEFGDFDHVHGSSISETAKTELCMKLRRSGMNLGSA